MGEFGNSRPKSVFHFRERSQIENYWTIELYKKKEKSGLGWVEILYVINYENACGLE